MNKFQIKFDGETFSPGQELRLRRACALAAEMSAAAVKRRGENRKKRQQKWLGRVTDDEEVVTDLKMMDAIFRDYWRTITFVDMRSKRVEDESGRLVPFDSIAGACAHRLTDPNRRVEARRQGASHHVGSGMRILVGTALLEAGDWTMARVVYHEITHKVLGLGDHTYGREECLALAQGGESQNAVLNADSWSFYAESFLLTDRETEP